MSRGARKRRPSVGAASAQHEGPGRRARGWPVGLSRPEGSTAPTWQEVRVYPRSLANRLDQVAREVGADAFTLYLAGWVWCDDQGRITRDAIASWPPGDYGYWVAGDRCLVGYRPGGQS